MYIAYDKPVFTIEEIEEILLFFGSLEEENTEVASILVGTFQAVYDEKCDKMDEFPLDSGELLNSFSDKVAENMDPATAYRIFGIMKSPGGGL